MSQIKTDLETELFEEGISDVGFDGLLFWLNFKLNPWSPNVICYYTRPLNEY